MNKWIYVIRYIVLLSYISTSCVFSSLEKIAIIDISDIFQQSKQRAIIAKQLEEEFKDRAIELQSIEQDLQKKIQNFQRNSPIMRVNERNELEKSIISKREEFSNKAKIFQQDNQIRQTEERNKILNMIQKIVEIIAEKEGYELIIDKGAIAYSSNIEDITEKILKQVK